MDKRDTYKYKWTNGRKILGYGITNNLKQRTSEHLAEVPGSRIDTVGNKTTERSAREWGKNKISEYVRRMGDLPPKNKPRSLSSRQGKVECQKTSYSKT